jgi:hydrogenase maturation protein HypF
MELEFAIQPGVEDSYSFRMTSGTPGIIDWQPVIEEILKDLKRARSTGIIAAKFHNTLVEIIVSVARRAGEKKVVLSGGCFQNRYLTERGVRRLTEAGFQPYWHQRVPTNDGGISLGQIIGAAVSRRLVPISPDHQAVFKERELDSGAILEPSRRTPQTTLF